MNSCTHCNRTFSNSGGLGAHTPYCKINPNRIQRIVSPNAHAKKGSVPWNKGKKGLQPAWNKGILGSTTGKGATAEKELARKEKIKKKAKIKNGGYRQGSGRGKKGWYKGFFCDSSWELAYVVYCLDHDIDIKRNTEKLQYIWNASIKNYIPDFIVNGVLTEIKGYKTDQWLAKLESNPDIKVLYEKDLQTVLSYVISKYGKNYIELYNMEVCEQGAQAVLKTAPPQG